jgi:organic hydroperoxide reductase OsmC/OhrA
MHAFPFSLRWSDSTAAEYSRDAVVTGPQKPELPTSAGPTYGGDPSRWNPEELFGSAVAMCHMLTFLALAKKARIDVRAYADDALVTLDVVDGVTRVTRVLLRPTITVAAGADAKKTEELFRKAHKYCFISNSITSETVMEPNVVVQP